MNFLREKGDCAEDASCESFIGIFPHVSIAGFGMYCAIGVFHHAVFDLFAFLGRPGREPDAIPACLLHQLYLRIGTNLQGNLHRVSRIQCSWHNKPLDKGSFTEQDCPRSIVLRPLIIYRQARHENNSKPASTSKVAITLNRAELQGALLKRRSGSEPDRVA